MLTKQISIQMVMLTTPTVILCIVSVARTSPAVTWLVNLLRKHFTDRCSRQWRVR